jgi:hypothetical protein
MRKEDYSMEMEEGEMEENEQALLNRLNIMRIARKATPLVPEEDESLITVEQMREAVRAGWNLIYDSPIGEDVLDAIVKEIVSLETGIPLEEVRLGSCEAG